MRSSEERWVVLKRQKAGMRAVSCKCVRAREYVYVVPVAGHIVAPAGWRPVAPGRKALRWLAFCLV
jgi:hypothetical protein